MGKLVRVLVIIMLPLAVGALVLGIMLFEKRELLVGRTDTLERQVIKLSKFVEEQDAEKVTVAHPAKDVSAVEARQVANPDTDPFWEGYDDSLETANLNTFEWDNETTKMKLREYYELDAEGKIKRDIQNRKSRNGAMKKLLDGLQDRAQAQHQTLQTTRAQMVKVRKELENTIDELNAEKSRRRGDLIKIQSLEGQIAQLESEKARLQSQVANLEQEKRELNEEIARLTTEIQGLEESLLAANIQVGKLEDEIKKLRIQLAGPRNGIEPQNAGVISVGDKGYVVSVDTEWNFAVVELTPEFMAEITTEEGGQPTVLLYVRHKGATIDKVTNRLKVDRFKFDENLGIGTILIDWQQEPLQPGDIVFF